MHDSPPADRDVAMKLNYKDFGAGRLEFDVCGKKMSLSQIQRIYYEHLDADENLYSLNKTELKQVEKIVAFFEDNKKLTAHCLDNPEHYYGAIARRVHEGCCFCNEEKRVAQIQEEQAKKEAQHNLRVEEINAQLEYFRDNSRRLEQAVEASMNEMYAAKKIADKAKAALHEALNNDELNKVRAELDKLKRVMPQNVGFKYPVLSRHNDFFNDANDFLDRSTSLRSMFNTPYLEKARAEEEQLRQEYRRDELMMDAIEDAKMEAEADRDADGDIDGGYF
tara:strand:- start:318 stop:1154 length:837 start_codon:yes stop_codon:yes gene_type:complete